MGGLVLKPWGRSKRLNALPPFACQKQQNRSDEFATNDPPDRRRQKISHVARQVPQGEGDNDKGQKRVSGDSPLAEQENAYRRSDRNPTQAGRNYFLCVRVELAG